MMRQQQQKTETNIEGILAEHQLDLWAQEEHTPAQDLSSITEIIMRGEAWNNVQTLLPLLAQLSHDQRWLAWVAPPRLLPKAQLRAAGFDLDKIILLKPDSHHDTMSLAKQALKSGTCHTVISWFGSLAENQLNDLAQAAELGNSRAFLIRHQ
ncbi:SulA-like leucine-rich domain-containing protein [Candidatus Njordibacter sp. Uisw_056]|jgi:cell division inhibitor SulA|uniref:cell division inhibitor SulA n=1 Tax=Candidatus Njordibacter sp. Uisw_056 TaxID=3230973 RepID=UPI003D3ACAFB|tara:strand:- start:24 stop:482 length:459 start_codon:yes stop_codon:yes gene_type:complete